MVEAEIEGVVMRMPEKRSELRSATPDWVADAAVELVNYAVDRIRVDGTRVPGKRMRTRYSNGFAFGRARANSIRGKRAIS